MTWVRLESSFPEHQKVRGLSDAAVAAWLRALCYCGQWETDGHVPARALRTMARPRVRRELEESGLWREARDGGVQLHDYLDWNPSKKYLEDLREKRRQAGLKGAAKTWQKPWQEP